MISILKFLYRRIPILGLLWNFRKITVNYFYDIRRYLRFSTTCLKPYDYYSYEARIVIQAHSLEKGLAMPSPRCGFGRPSLDVLVELLKEYLSAGYPHDAWPFQVGTSVIEKYVEFHEKRNFDVAEIKKALEEITTAVSRNSGGVDLIKRRDIIQYSQGNFAELAASRHSIRNFTDEEVALSSIHEAIEIAQKTPSVCNRQTCRVYVIKNPDTRKAALDCQSGNRGFGHLINTLLLVSTDLRSFSGIHERNQGFIDGGMFAMSLVYALSYKGLGTVTLNWATEKETDLRLRKSVPIRESETIIMFIGVGHIPGEIKVPLSKRKISDEIYTVLH